MNSQLLNDEVAKANGIPADWRDGPHLACWVEKIPDGHAEGERATIFGHKCRIWLSEHKELLARLRNGEV